MTAPPDVLIALRAAVKQDFAITFAEDGLSCTSIASATHIVVPTSDIGEPLRFAKSAPTRFRKPDATTDFYSVGAVLAAWLFRDSGAAEYMRQAREAGFSVGFVSVTERKGIVDWLEGRRTEHDRLAPLGGGTTPPGTPPPSAPGANAPESPESPSKRRYVPDALDLEAVKKIRLNEIELCDRNTVLRGTKINNFSNVRALLADRLKKLKETSKPGQPSISASAAPKSGAPVANKKRTNYPIIMISSSPTSLITMHNVKKFLEESVFEPSETARAAAAAQGITKPDDVIAIYRRRTHIGPGGKEVEERLRYFVVDGIEALAKFGGDPWDRVVCVMTTGQAWQFRPYKWTEPLQLFHHVKGIYVAWATDPPNPKIQDWNVTDLRIDPNRRHVDKQVVAHFWKTLDTWVATHKPGVVG